VSDDDADMAEVACGVSCVLSSVRAIGANVFGFSVVFLARDAVTLSKNDSLTDLVLLTNVFKELKTRHEGLGVVFSRAAMLDQLC